MDATTGILVFVAGLSFLGAQKGAKTQIETTEKSVENYLSIPHYQAKNEINIPKFLKKI